VQAETLAYLVIVMENQHESRLDEDVQALAEHMSELGAIDVYVLSGQTRAEADRGAGEGVLAGEGRRRRRHHRHRGPRASIADYMVAVKGHRGVDRHVFVAGCGHAGAATCTCRSTSPIRTSASAVLASCSRPASHWAG